MKLYKILSPYVGLLCYCFFFGLLTNMFSLFKFLLDIFFILLFLVKFNTFCAVVDLNSIPYFSFIAITITSNDCRIEYKNSRAFCVVCLFFFVYAVGGIWALSFGFLPSRESKREVLRWFLTVMKSPVASMLRVCVRGGCQKPKLLTNTKKWNQRHLLNPTTTNQNQLERSLGF